jgi:hypothetical protein
MSESTHHAFLVERIVEWIVEAHNRDGLSLLVDALQMPRHKRPYRIGGFTPDVHACTTPPSIVVVGEAKSFDDMFSPRTERQLTAFIEYLSAHESSVLIVASPLACRGAARSIVRRIQRRLGTAVQTHFLSA